MGAAEKGGVAGGGSDPAVALTLAEALEAAEPEATLLWGGPVAVVAARWAGGAELRLASDDAGYAAEVVGRDCEVTIEPGPGEERRIVCPMPRSREMLTWVLAQARHRLPEGGQLWLAGHRRDGIKSAVAPLAEAIGEVSVVHIKRHCRVLVATRGPGEAPAPDLEAHSASFEAPTPFGPLRCVTAPGTFAYGRLDPGTELLLRTLEGLDPFAAALDLGCGAGILGAALAMARPGKRIVMTDISAAAVASTRRTLAASGIEGPEVLLGDVAELPHASFDLALSNPPHHRGRAEDRAVGARFVAEASRRLRRGGRMLLVSNRHVPYGHELGEHFHRSGVLVENNAFRVWEGVK